MLYNLLKFERWGLTLWLLTASAFGAWMAVSIMDNQVPYEFIREGSKLIPNPSHQGEQVMLHWKIKVFRTCPGTLERWIVDPQTGQTVATYDSTPSASTIRKTDTDLYKVFTLPTGLPPRVIYRTRISFHCNLLQQFFPLVLNSPDIEFGVIP